VRIEHKRRILRDDDVLRTLMEVREMGETAIRRESGPQVTDRAEATTALVEGTPFYGGLAA